MQNYDTDTIAANAKSDGEAIAETQSLPIHIPKGASLEEPPQPEAKTGQGFPDAVFNDLPDVLRNACEVLTEQTEKEVFLVGAFAVISGILPNVRGFYDGGYTCPNLFAYIIGQYGTGKGGLKLAYKIAQPIHSKRRELSKDL